MSPHGATGAAPWSPSGALPRSSLLGEPALEEALLEAAQHGFAAAQGSAAADKAALAPRVVASYSLGHVLNDLSASAWFSYLIFFLKKVRHLPAPDAGLVMLCGQLADAVGTVTSGLLSDRSEGCAPLGLGRRKLWYIAGTVTVAVCFSGIFTVELVRGEGQTAYYAAAASLFNVGWAAVQVSHMALLPELTSNAAEQVTLNSCRYAASVIANISVFLMLALWADVLGPEDKYTGLGASIVAVGLITSVLFLWGTPEPAHHKESESERLGLSAESDNAAAPAPLLPREQSQAQPQRRRMTWKRWLREPCLWLVGTVYTGARMVVNVSSVYSVFYVKDTLKLSDKAIVTVPLLMYLGSLIASASLSRLQLGPKRGYALGSASTLAALAIMLALKAGEPEPEPRPLRGLGAPEPHHSGEPEPLWGSGSVLVPLAGWAETLSRAAPPAAPWALYPAAVLLGFGNAIQMVISGSLGAEMISARPMGDNAFVFGCMSFMDKLANGLAIYAIEAAMGHKESQGQSTAAFVRAVFCLVPALSAVVSCATPLALPRHLLCPHQTYKQTKTRVRA
jgi:Na+/melibiose symporter-like transporter